jgi:hypothetical protein
MEQLRRVPGAGGDQECPRMEKIWISRKHEAGTPGLGKMLNRCF